MEVHIGDRIADIELLEKNGNNVQVSIDGEIFNVDMTMTDNGSCSILHNGKSYNMEVLRSENGKNYKVNWLFSSFDVSVVDAQAKYLQSRRSNDTRQDDNLCAPMPGKVVKIEVNAGDTVQAGSTVIVFEAMKMQSYLKVTEDCIVKEIFVSEGDSAASGQLLMKLDILKNTEE